MKQRGSSAATGLLPTRCWGKWAAPEPCPGPLCFLQYPCIPLGPKEVGWWPGAPWDRDRARRSWQVGPRKARRKSENRDACKEPRPRAAQVSAPGGSDNSKRKIPAGEGQEGWSLLLFPGGVLAQGVPSYRGYARQSLPRPKEKSLLFFFQVSAVLALLPTRRIQAGCPGWNATLPFPCPRGWEGSRSLLGRRPACRGPPPSQALPSPWSTLVCRVQGPACQGR